MIPLTRLDGATLVVNCDHILYAEHTPDTVLTLSSGARLIVREPLQEVVERVVSFRRRAKPPVVVGPPQPPEGAEVVGG